MMTSEVLRRLTLFRKVARVSPDESMMGFIYELFKMDEELLYNLAFVTLDDHMEQETKDVADFVRRIQRINLGYYIDVVGSMGCIKVFGGTRAEPISDSIQFTGIDSLLVKDMLLELTMHPSSKKRKEMERMNGAAVVLSDAYRRFRWTTPGRDDPPDTIGMGPDELGKKDEKGDGPDDLDDLDRFFRSQG